MNRKNHFLGRSNGRQQALRVTSVPFLENPVIQEYTQLLAQTENLSNIQARLTPKQAAKSHVTQA